MSSSMVGFIGAGRMAQALAKGFIKGGVRKPHQILASAPKNDIQSIEEMKSLGCKTTNSNKDVLNDAEVVIMAIKPNIVPKVVHEIRNDVTMKNLLVSIALGIPIKAIEDVLPVGSRVIRVMSNTPAIVSAGATVFSTGTFAGSNDAEMVKELFSSVGICDQVTENLIDAVTGLSGSGPAYCYLAIEALADGGVRQGLPRDLAIKLAAQTLLGSAKMVLETGRHPGSLKDDVCSPAGCTIQGLAMLERSGFRSSLIEAVDIATKTAQITALSTSNLGQSSTTNTSRHDEPTRRLNGKKLVINNILQ